MFLIKNEFQNVLHPSTSDMLDTIAGRFLSGLDPEEEKEIFEEQTDGEMARVAIRCWGLDNPDEDDPSHMEFNGYSVIELAQAFARLRARASGGDSVTAEAGPSATYSRP